MKLQAETTIVNFDIPSSNNGNQFLDRELHFFKPKKEIIRLEQLKKTKGSRADIITEYWFQIDRKNKLSKVFGFQNGKCISIYIAYENKTNAFAIALQKRLLASLGKPGIDELYFSKWKIINPSQNIGIVFKSAEPGEGLSLKELNSYPQWEGYELEVFYEPVKVIN